MMTIVVSTRLDQDELNQLRLLAAERGGTVGKILRDLVSAALVLRHMYSPVVRGDFCKWCFRKETNPIHLSNEESRVAVKEMLEAGIGSPTG